jgi:hypothetical protein
MATPGAAAPRPWGGHPWPLGSGRAAFCGDSGDICMYPAKSRIFPAAGGGVCRGIVAAEAASGIDGGWDFFFLSD